MKATFFASPTDFRKWLEKHYKTEKELIVGFYKVATGKPSINWSESVDQALCFGWIDGVRNSIDSESYCIRFTPRKPTSIWSAINIKKVETLTKAGLMTPEGQKAFSLKNDERSKIYYHEKEVKALDSHFEILFKKNKMAWDFFTTQAPSYKKTITHWITSAKQEKTKLARLEKLIKASEQQKRLV